MREIKKYPILAAMLTAKAASLVKMRKWFVRVV